jgi:hypothetical protein
MSTRKVYLTSFDLSGIFTAAAALGAFLILKGLL